jgi:peptide/nickel transport system substrate-binding protein
VIPLLRMAGSTTGTIDPARWTGTDIGLEQLMNYDNTGKIVPWLAQSVTQPGHAIYVYHLRHGVKFWDGNELTAEDVANSFNYERYPGSMDAFNFEGVKNVYATNRYTVVVTLTHPDPSWRYRVAAGSAQIFEKAFQQAHKDTFGKPGTMVMGTGPWKYDSFDPTTGEELSANPHWWGGKVNIQHISIKYVSNDQSAALAMRAGEIDASFPVDTRAFASSAGSGVNILTWPSCYEMYFSMPTKTPPWNDVHVRRAVAYAVNRAAIINARGGYATAQPTFIPNSLLLTVASQAQIDALIKSSPQYPYSLAKAKAELAKSAYPNGFSMTLDDPGFYGNVPQAFTGVLRSIGINAQTANKTIAVWFTEVSGPADKRPPTMVGGTCTSPSIAGFDWALGTKNTRPGQFNTANYASPAIDNWIATGETAAASNKAKAFSIYSKLFTQLQTDMPYVPVFLFDNALVLSKKLAFDANPGAIYGVAATGFWNTDWPLHLRPA